MSAIRFGTDGWRGVMADDFTFEGVARVAGAIADYIVGAGLGGRELIIGHDSRFLGAELGEVCRAVASEAGLSTCTFARPMPTPIVAYAIKHRQAAGAIMLTASHNPPEYNGIKFIPAYAGPANTEITKQIEANLESVRTAVGTAGSNNVIDVVADYVEALAGLVDIGAIAAAAPVIMADSMHGASCGIFAEVLGKAGANVKALDDDFDPTFGGRNPDPNATNLAALSVAVKDSGALLGLAVDGDGDRFGVVDHNGVWMSPNQIISILAEYLLETRKRSGALVRTVATTHYLDDIAAGHGVDLVETPVGFKWIASEMMSRDVTIGGEESGGLSIGGHIPEKDGILACLLVLEAAVKLDMSPSKQVERLAQRYGRRFSERVDIHVPSRRKEELLADLRDREINEIAGQPVADRVTIDGAKFVLDTGDWLLIRPSGTEPMVRVYLEAGSEERLAELSAFASSIMT